MRTALLLIAALCFDWLALAIAKSDGFVNASWWTIAAIPLYTFVLAVLAVFAVLIIAFLFLTARAVFTNRSTTNGH